KNAQSLDRLRRAEPEMRYPSRQVSADAFHAGCDGSSPTRRRHLPHFRPQSLLSFGGGKDGDSVAFLPSRASKAEAQELNLVGRAHATLLLVDLEPHARLQKSPNRHHDALSGALAAHEDIAIIGVANKPETSPRQFAVQLVEYDIGKQWRKRAPLRRSFLDRDLRPVRHYHRRFQHQANQGDDPWVLHAFRDPGQQALMMNSVKEFLITRLRQLQAPSRTKHEHAVFAGVVRWRAIRSSSRKASVRPVSPSFTEPKGNVMRRSSNGAGRTGSNVLGAMALITASSPAARGVYSSATRVASRLLSKRERSSLQASCRCASGSRRSTWSRNQRRAFPVSNSVDA